MNTNNKSTNLNKNQIRLVFFCGNPGREYAATRHNTAWIVLEKLEATETLSWQGKFNGYYARSYKLGTENNLLLLKPGIYMNLAGQCLGPAATFFKLVPENILVCHDDIELEFGTVAFKKGGGTGGHNGLRSIDKALKSSPEDAAGFYRLRIGISRPARGNVDSHVLGRFSPHEEAELDHYTALVAEQLETFLSSNSPQLNKKIKLLP